MRIPFSTWLHRCRFCIKELHTESDQKQRKEDREHIPIPAVPLLLLLLFSAGVIAVLAIVPRPSAPLSFALYSSDKSLLGASVAADGQWRFMMGAVPPKIGHAIIAFEDKRFYYHSGIDLLSVYRAAVSNAVSGRIVSGASTLTMQTARLIQNKQRRTYAQKIKEAVMALLLEMRYTKKDILSLYASLAPFGGNVVGIEAASWRYFNRAPEYLTWAEASTIAVLPNQPSLVHPGADRARLLQKRNNVLYTLFRRRCIDRETLYISLQEPLPFKPYQLPHYAPHYMEQCKRAAPTSPVFVSTIDKHMQIKLHETLTRWNHALSLSKINNAAAIIIDTKSGDIYAYVGNCTLEQNAVSASCNVDIIPSLRSSGSLLKPFLYAALLDAGEILPDQLLVDTPTRIGSYRPENNLHSYTGVIPASQALSRSLNIPWVRALQHYGITPFLAQLQQSGITTLTQSADYYGLPLILGGGEITLGEMVQVYAALTRKALTNNAAANNNTAQYTSPFSAGAAWLTLNALVTGERPANESMWQAYSSQKKIAWKTGTSFGNRDAWAIGTTPEYTVGIWIGNASGEGRPELKSFTTAAPILFEVFSWLPPTTWLPYPENQLTDVNVCAHSGFLAGGNCADTILSKKPVNAHSSALCPYCETVALTPDRRFRAQAQDLTGKWSGSLPVIEKRFVLPPWIEPYYMSTSVRYEPLPPWLIPHNTGSANEIAVVFPQAGTQIYIPVELDGTPGKMVMEARHRDTDATIYWDIDGTYYGTTQHYHQMTVRPGEGKHRLTLTDSSGRRASCSFTILSDNSY